MIRFPILLILYAGLVGALDLDVKIIGGRPSQINEIPYQVSLRGPRGVHFCGGAVIDASHILTAAHCCIFSAHEITVHAGSIYLNETQNVIKRKVKRIHIHKQYDVESVDNDIAIFQLTDPLPLFNSVLPATLQNVSVRPETSCRVSGWGRSNMTVYASSYILRTVDIVIIDHLNCSRSYARHGGITQNMLCAGSYEGGKDACQGDSGGPLMCGNKLTGIVSWGFECANKWYPGIYTNVSVYSDWIKEKLFVDNSNSYDMYNYSVVSIPTRPPHASGGSSTVGQSCGSHFTSFGTSAALVGLFVVLLIVG